MGESKGYIYILTNPSFPDYVKIGYADDVEQRLAQLNRSECTPFAFRVYATYEVDHRLSDMKIHNVIDRLNSELRSIDTVNGKKRIREFYAMTPEDAYSILEAIAEINGFEHRLKKWEQTEKQKVDASLAEIIAKESRTKAKAFTFSSCGINTGEYVSFVCNDNENSGAEAVVVDDRHVEYKGISYTLTGLARELLKKPSSAGVPGPDYFMYKGRWLNDIRRERGVINF